MKTLPFSVFSEKYVTLADKPKVDKGLPYKKRGGILRGSESARKPRRFSQPTLDRTLTRPRRSHRAGRGLFSSLAQLCFYARRRRADGAHRRGGTRGGDFRHLVFVLGDEQLSRAFSDEGAGRAQALRLRRPGDGDFEHLPRLSGAGHFPAQRDEPQLHVVCRFRQLHLYFYRPQYAAGVGQQPLVDCLGDGGVSQRGLAHRAARRPHRLGGTQSPSR